jgi:hypothetical protein
MTKTTTATPNLPPCKYAEIKWYREKLEKRHRYRQTQEFWVDLGGEG